MSAARAIRSSRLPATWILAAAGLVFVGVLALGWSLAPVGGVAVACAAGALLGVTAGAAPERKVTAGVQCDAEGKPKRFTLAIDHESVTLEPGRNWTQLDHFKWVTRGQMDAPQSFHVHGDGALDINGEHIRLADRDALQRLEHEINKHHSLDAIHAAPLPARQGAAVVARPSDRAVFAVRLDHLGHLMIECFRGNDRTETGLRGLSGLVQSGLMVKPRTLHVDPLQRYIEIDDARFPADEIGARQLEEALNSRYAQKLEASGDRAIEVKENAAAAAGFDLHFVTVRAGARFEVKGHLDQDHLDILQDPAKCNLLRPDIVLKISPPFLFIRRRRSDGGEEHLPEFPDLQYRRATAAQLEAIFNHPLLRRSGATAAVTNLESADAIPDLSEIYVGRNPQTKSLLWMTCVRADGREPLGKALTHHNIADLQRAGLFLPHLDVNLAMDNRTLSVLNKETGSEIGMVLDGGSSEEDLQRAGKMLTAALRPPRPRPPKAQPGTAPPLPPEPAPLPPKPGGIVTPGTATAPRLDAVVASREAPLRAVPPEPLPAAVAPPAEVPFSPSVPLPPILDTPSEPPPSPPPAPRTAPVPPPPVPVPPESESPALFTGWDAGEVIERCFRCLGPRFGIEVQTVRLSLPRVFTDRLFEILALDGTQVASLFELRSRDFYGFYLSHVREGNPDLVYACAGVHVEFGVERCMVQSSASADPADFKGHGLLGLAQDAAGQFVFVVAPAYKAWVKPLEKACAEAYAHFHTPRELAASPGQYALIWPEETEPTLSA